MEWATTMKTIKWDRRPISRPGIYTDIPLGRYHSADITVGPSVSSSGLRTLFIDSPSHYWDQSPYNPDGYIREQTPSLILGRATHHLLLGQDNFRTEYVVRPDRFDSWRTKDAQAWRADHERQGYTVLLPEHLDQIKGMARSLAKHPLVKAGILDGSIEQSLIWRDKETGLWLRSRPDATPNDSGDFADLKGTASVKWADSAIWTYRYDMQAAMQKWAARELLGIDMKEFHFVFVEFKRPHCVDVLTVTNDDIEQAEVDLRVALRTMAHCLKTKNWFGPGGTQHDARYAMLPDDKSFRRVLANYTRNILEREIEGAK